MARGCPPQRLLPKEISVNFPPRKGTRPDSKANYLSTQGLYTRYVYHKVYDKAGAVYVACFNNKESK